MALTPELSTLLNEAIVEVARNRGSIGQVPSTWNAEREVERERILAIERQEAEEEMALTDEYPDDADRDDHDADWSA